jgi:hypothetical protein
VDIQIPDAPSQALIVYPRESAPLLVSERDLVFEGTLASAPRTELPIRSATMVAWWSGLNREVEPVPTLDVPFRAEIPARIGACGTILSWHGGNRWGGCWWPIGANGGCSGLCTREHYEQGLCTGEPCEEGRGCTPIETGEPERPPPPERDDTIPTAPPRALPPDAGFDAAGDAEVS